jgi:hypothetical protein
MKWLTLTAFLIVAATISNNLSAQEPILFGQTLSKQFEGFWGLSFSTPIGQTLAAAKKKNKMASLESNGEPVICVRNTTLGGYEGDVYLLFTKAGNFDCGVFQFKITELGVDGTFDYFLKKLRSKYGEPESILRAEQFLKENPTEYEKMAAKNRHYKRMAKFSVKDKYDHNIILTLEILDTGELMFKAFDEQPFMKEVYDEARKQHNEY